MNTTFLDQIIEPFAECLTQEAALKIVAIKADGAIQGRIDELADKSNAGTLTEIEQSEYDRTAIDSKYQINSSSCTDLRTITVLPKPHRVSVVIDCAA